MPAVAALAAVAWLHGGAAGQCAPQVLAPADLEEGDEFAQSVSISGSTIAIGVPLDDIAGADSGSVRIFEPQGVEWIQTATIAPADGAADDRFGTSVGISGDTLVVGAPRDNDNGAIAGAVYVYERSAGKWMFVDKLLPTAVVTGDRFGGAVATDGDTIVAGAPMHDLQGVNSGSAYVFERSPGAGSGTWTLIDELLAPVGATTMDEFGSSVAIDGNRIVIGAPRDDESGTAAGAVHVFEHDGQQWVHDDVMRLFNGSTGHRFGAAVDIDGDVIVIGAWGDNAAGDRSGSAYVYAHSSTAWTQTLRIEPDDLSADDQFGRALALRGDALLIGAPGQDDDAVNSGATYRYTFVADAWQLADKLAPTMLNAGDRFGWSIGMSGEVAVVSSVSTAMKGVITGAAHVFNDGPACHCPADLADDDGAVNVFDLLALLANWGADGAGAALAEPNDVVDVFDLLELLSSWGEC